MTDITTELERLANLKPYDGWPADGAVSAICAEALAEILCLKRELKDYIVKDGKEMAEIRRLSFQYSWNPWSQWPGRKIEPVAPISGRFVPGVGVFLPIQPQTQSAPEPAPEPWGSSFAMNTENWK